MKNPKIIFQGKSRKGTDVVIRYPKMSDFRESWKYINALSKEKTFVTYQGEKVPLKDQKKWLKEKLEGIRKKKEIGLSAFVGERIVGVCGIKMRSRVRKHIGSFVISIAKDLRGEGIGRLLMDAVFEEAKKKLKNLKIVTLEVFEENLVAREMYKKDGFKEIGVLPEGLYYRGGYSNEVLMYKKL